LPLSWTMYAFLVLLSILFFLTFRIVSTCGTLTLILRLDIWFDAVRLLLIDWLSEIT
jgi:hypothetical protein